MRRFWQVFLCATLFCAAGLALAQGMSPESVFIGVPFVQGAPVREQPDIAYPAEALRRKLNGVVVVAVLVDEEGVPLRHRVLSADPPLIFDAVVRQAIPQFLFKPVERGGKRVAFETHLTLKFAP